jgi:hypothetical protein
MEQAHPAALAEQRGQFPAVALVVSKGAVPAIIGRAGTSMRRDAGKQPVASSRNWP